MQIIELKAQLMHRLEDQLMEHAVRSAELRAQLAHRSAATEADLDRASAIPRCASKRAEEAVGMYGRCQALISHLANVPMDIAGPEMEFEDVFVAALDDSSAKFFAGMPEDVVRGDWQEWGIKAPYTTALDLVITLAGQLVRLPKVAELERRILEDQRRREAELAGACEEQRIKMAELERRILENPEAHGLRHDGRLRAPGRPH